MKNQVIDNLNREFIVYKSDMIETINVNNEKLFAKFDTEIRELHRDMKEIRMEMRSDMKEVRSDMKGLDEKIDKFYRLFSGLLVSVIVGIVVGVAVQFVKY